MSRPGADQYRGRRPDIRRRGALRTPGEQFGLLQPEPVGELVAEAILRNRFFVPTHPRVVDELRRRVEDWDAYIDYQISREPRL